MLFYVNMKNQFKLLGSGKNFLSFYNKGLSVEIVFIYFFKIGILTVYLLMTIVLKVQY